MEVGQVKPSKSRALRRRDTFLCSVKPENVQQINPRQFLEFDVPSDIALLHQADPTLKAWFDNVSEVEGKKQSRVDVLADATHVIRDDILY